MFNLTLPNKITAVEVKLMGGGLKKLRKHLLGGRHFDTATPESPTLDEAHAGRYDGPRKTFNISMGN